MVPLIILSHREQQFLPGAIESLQPIMDDISDLIVVDDSGNADHHEWLDRNGIQFSVVRHDRNSGYLEAMRRVWEVAGDAIDAIPDCEHALLWEEDFRLTGEFSVPRAVETMDAHPRLAQLNLQRQKVYKIEKRLGYMQSHQARGYTLTAMSKPWPFVARRRPFTTNPGLIRRAALDVSWPSETEARDTRGGAEPAMSERLEALGWRFGWYGPWDSPNTEHIGLDMKSGTGY